MYKNPLLIEVNIYLERSFPVVYCRYVLLFENVFYIIFLARVGDAPNFILFFPKNYNKYYV